MACSCPRINGVATTLMSTGVTGSTLLRGSSQQPIRAKLWKPTMIAEALPVSPEGDIKVEVYEPGDIVLTTYGAGVIVGVKDGRFSVRLWRQIGKSVASAALAHLNCVAIMRKIPAAPGMTTTAKDPDVSTVREVLVLAYYASTDRYFVANTGLSTSRGRPKLKENSSEPINVETPENTNLDDLNRMVVRSQDLSHAPTAKFYPLLETLMTRGDETIRSATVLLQDEQMKSLVDKTNSVIQNRMSSLSSKLDGGDDIGDAKHKLAVAAVSLERAITSTSIDSNVKTVLELVKDKDFTDLLETCRSRLAEITEHETVSYVTMEKLAKSTIYFDSDVSPSSFVKSMDLSRKAALTSLNELLRELELDSYTGDIESFQARFSLHFGQVFDSLSKAATSDESLNALFRNIHDKSREWQEATGRIWDTRSAGLFLEGASRLQQRAAAIFSQGHLQWAGEIGEKLTKSFTEGDAALARLKSIELADVLKESLVAAIEVRSESVGGLDGIIASALSQIKDKSAESGETLQSLLKNLQKGASSAAIDAHETLLYVLSSRSVYRDVCLLRVENVLCALNDQFGEALSAQGIAQLAYEDGGTAKLFEPIAKQAMIQIEKQLDIAESSINDSTALEVLRKVRKLMSGELAISSVMDDLVNVLNDETFVRASEKIVQHSEQVLDLIEGVSANQAVNDAMKVVEKAGITKSSVMAEFEKLNMSELMDTAGSAITDERARLKLLSTATDAALDFVLRILPSMPVPPFEGVKDGLIYYISNLSMEGFKVRKEDIHIRLAGMHATQDGRNGEMAALTASAESYLDFQSRQVQANELLIIDIQSISAVLDDAEWSFEQTYMPYLKAQGLANVSFNGGAIRLQFELRKQRKEGALRDWEPVLCLHDRTCTISEVDLTLQGESRLAWIINKAASIFRGPLRDYLVRTVKSVLVSHSGWILQRLNGILSPHWGLIMNTAQLEMKDLVEVDERVVSKEISRKDQSFIELVWRDQLPLGINLLLNDESGVLKVVDFPRGSQARVVCEKKNLDPDIFKGSRIVSVNGSQYGGMIADLFAALKDPGRPKTIRFEVAGADEAERVRAFVAQDSNIKDNNSEAEGMQTRTSLQLREFTLHTHDNIGMSFCRSLDNGLIVQGFLEGEDGIILAAERSLQVKLGDLLVKINDVFVTTYADALVQLEKAIKIRPLRLSFCDPYLHVKTVTRTIDGVGGGDELKLTRVGQKVIISGFNNMNGKAEKAGIMIGDHLVFLNGQPVGVGCRWLDVHPAPSLRDIQRMIEDESLYPMGLTFARPMRDTESLGVFRDDEAETICVTVERPCELGCILKQKPRTLDTVVADFQSIPGNIQMALRDLPPGLSIQAINGQTVPSYASEDMVKSAITRSWTSDNQVELWLSDDNVKDWLHNLVQSESNK